MKHWQVLYFHYSVATKNLFNSYSHSETDLISPGLWEIFGEYVSLFGRVATLPWDFSVTERKLCIAKTSFRKRGILKFSSFLMIGYTFTTFIILMHKVLFCVTNNQDTKDTIRTFMMLYVICLFPALIPISFIISFRGGQICSIINPITQFQPAMSGK